MCTLLNVKIVIIFIMSVILYFMFKDSIFLLLFLIAKNSFISVTQREKLFESLNWVETWKKPFNEFSVQFMVCLSMKINFLEIIEHFLQFIYPCNAYRVEFLMITVGMVVS